MENSWRASLTNGSRLKIVKRITNTFQRHMSVAGQDGVDELFMIASRFEEKIFQAATDQQDYLRKISLKMLSLETKANGNPSQARDGVPVPQAAGQAAMKPVDAAALAMRNAAQTLGNGVQLGGQSQQQQQLQQQQLQQRQQQQLLYQSIPANVGAGGIQTPASGLGSNLSTKSGA